MCAEQADRVVARGERVSIRIVAVGAHLIAVLAVVDRAERVAIRVRVEVVLPAREKVVARRVYLGR